MTSTLPGSRIGSEATAPARGQHNPLLQPWRGPHGGVPPFDTMRIEHLRPALEAGMAEQLAEIERIAGNRSPATFENTLAALERSGRTLERVMTAIGIYTSTLSEPLVEEIERDMAPRLAEFRDRITQNGALYARIAAVYEARDSLGLTPEQSRLAWRHHTDFVRAGAMLDSTAKNRVGIINQRLATLFAEFGQNVLADENDRFVLLDQAADLDGLPESLRTAAAAAAQARGYAGKWAILNTRSIVEPFLEYSHRRARREEVFRMFIARGDNRDAHDTNAQITEILKLRAERARLLGYPTHAHWRVADQMAKTPERALALMEAVWHPAVARVRQEVADMQTVANRGNAVPITLEPWDYRYYAESVRRERYDLDASELKPYLQMERLRDGMHYMAERLFGLRFTPVPPGEIPVYHSDVRVWSVTDRTGHDVGLWYLDPYARPGKRSGAWMNEYRRQERLDGPVTAIVSNNANFVPAAAGEPVLISWDDAVTMFHEFGHALHGLLSNVTYPTLSGTSVPTDYVEFPSQLIEHWLATPEILSRFAVHHDTGESIPAALVDKLREAHNFNQGFKTVEYLSAALIDMKLHLTAEPTTDPRAFERDTLAALGMPREVVMRHRTPQFSHVFSSDYYSAGYYSYLWADTLSADAWEAFTQAGGPWDAGVAERLLRNVFSAGGTRDPAEAYRAFRGHDPDAGALMRNRGLA